MGAVGALSSEGAGLYSAALASTQLWLLWPYGVLYRNTQPVQLAQGLMQAHLMQGRIFLCLKKTQLTNSVVPVYTG